MGQILPESEKKTPKNQCHHPSAISRYKQYWLQHKLEIRKGKGGFEEHIETQTTHREFIDLPEQWAWEGKELLHLREAWRTLQEKHNIAEKEMPHLPINS